MSRRPHTKSKIRVINKHSVFNLQDKSSDDKELSNALIKSAKRSGQLSLCNRGLGSVPENVWKIEEIVLEDQKDLDFNRSDTNNWWNCEPLRTLDLSSNVIKIIPSQIKQLFNLTSLKLHDNAIEELPAEIGCLTNLTTFSVSHNRLTKLPSDFFKLTELRILIMSHNKLDTLQPEFGDLVMLTKLDLSHNNLKTLPPGMGFLVRLVDLNFSHNHLNELPPDIVNLRDLKKMDLNHNDLKLLPPMGELRRMEILDVNHNDLEALPDFYGCTALKELYLANNFITEITEEFCDQMQHLNVLNLRDNKLELLPENISLLKKLKRLDITNNNLNKLPGNLGLLSQLQSLNMEGNKFTSLRQDVIQGGTERMLKYLRERVSTEEPEEKEIKELAWPDKYTMRKAQALQLCGRDLDHMPDNLYDVGVEAQVHIVDLSRNKFSSISTGVVKLSETLTQLLLTSNMLSSLPPELSQCKHLQYMELSKNQLSDLPITFSDFKNMREIVINSNRFSNLPRCIYEMDKLEILLAADNQITEVNVSSDALARLKNLAVLDLRNNSIMTVPPELGNFTQLRSLELMGNCFRQPRHAILEKGTHTLLSYLRDRIPS